MDYIMANADGPISLILLIVLIVGVLYYGLFIQTEEDRWR